MDPQIVLHACNLQDGDAAVATVRATLSGVAGKCGAA